MEQIKRANRLYTNDSIFLKKSLTIPVISDLDDCSNGLDVAEEDGNKGSGNSASLHNGHIGSSSEKKQEDRKDLTPGDFLKRLDDLISQSKQAAVKGCQEAEKRYNCACRWLLFSLHSCCPVRVITLFVFKSLIVRSVGPAYAYVFSHNPWAIILMPFVFLNTVQWKYYVTQINIFFSRLILEHITA